MPSADLSLSNEMQIRFPEGKLDAFNDCETLPGEAGGDDANSDVDPRKLAFNEN